MIVHTFIIFWIVLLSACAGGTGVETPNSFKITVFETDSTPASYARVRLYSQDYSPLSDPNSFQEFQLDSKGTLKLDSDVAGMIMEIILEDEGVRTIINENVSLKLEKLQSFSIQFSNPIEEQLFEALGSSYIFQVDSGGLTVLGIPIGEYVFQGTGQSFSIQVSSDSVLIIEDNSLIETIVHKNYQLADTLRIFSDQFLQNQESLLNYPLAIQIPKTIPLNSLCFRDTLGVALLYESGEGNLDNRNIRIRIPTIEGAYSKAILITTDLQCATSSQRNSIFDGDDNYLGVWNFTEDLSGGLFLNKADLNFYSCLAPNGTATMIKEQNNWGSALTFYDGDNYLDCGNIALNDSALSISMWARLDEARDYARLISKTMPAPSYHNFGIISGTVASNSFQFIVSHDNLRSGTNYLWEPIGAWFHLAAVWNRDLIQIYINGELVANTESINATPAQSIESFVIGSNPFDFQQRWIGSIAELQILNRTMLPSEIRAEAISHSTNYFELRTP
jgi:hypothetical protein